ncbi:hypothetical protein MUP65_02310 [Patescibacteria group bacterium]|nr:hypothetical protein [Patescibacteria group bacterium]
MNEREARRDETPDRLDLFYTAFASSHVLAGRLDHGEPFVYFGMDTGDGLSAYPLAAVEEMLQDLLDEKTFSQTEESVGRGWIRGTVDGVPVQGYANGLAKLTLALTEFYIKNKTDGNQDR